MAAISADETSALPGGSERLRYMWDIHSESELQLLFFFDTGHIIPARIL